MERKYESCYAVEAVGQKLVYVDPTKCVKYVPARNGFVTYKSHCADCRGYKHETSTLQRLS